MPSSWIVETVNVFKQGGFHLPPGLPDATPDEFRHEGFEEGFDDGVIVTGRHIRFKKP